MPSFLVDYHASRSEKVLRANESQECRPVLRCQHLEIKVSANLPAKQKKACTTDDDDAPGLEYSLDDLAEMSICVCGLGEKGRRGGEGCVGLERKEDGHPWGGDGWKTRQPRHRPSGAGTRLCPRLCMHGNALPSHRHI